MTNFDIGAKTRTAFSARVSTQVDWFRVLVELKGRGWSLQAISEAIEVPKSTIHKWGDGSSPNYTDGLALLDLWSAVVHVTPLTIKRPR